MNFGQLHICKKTGLWPLTYLKYIFVHQLLSTLYYVLGEWVCGVHVSTCMSHAHTHTHAHTQKYKVDTMDEGCDSLELGGKNENNHSIT